MIEKELKYSKNLFVQEKWFDVNLKSHLLRIILFFFFFFSLLIEDLISDRNLDL